MNVQNIVLYPIISEYFSLKQRSKYANACLLNMLLMVWIFWTEVNKHLRIPVLLKLLYMKKYHALNRSSSWWCYVKRSWGHFYTCYWKVGSRSSSFVGHNILYINGFCSLSHLLKTLNKDQNVMKQILSG